MKLKGAEDFMQLCILIQRLGVILQLQPAWGEKGSCGETHPWPLSTLMYGVFEGKHGLAGVVVCHPEK